MLHTLSENDPGGPAKLLSGGFPCVGSWLMCDSYVRTLHTRDTLRSSLPARTLVLRTLGAMVDQVLFHDLLSEAQDVRILGIDDGPHPVRIRVAKGRDSREVFNGSTAGGTEQ